MSELFDIPECLSPRLKWMKDHGILTHHNPDCDPPWIAIKPMLPEHKGKNIGEIMGDACRLYDEGGWIGEGEGEADAMADLARKINLPSWH